MAVSLHIMFVCSSFYEKSSQNDCNTDVILCAVLLHEQNNDLPISWPQLFRLKTFREAKI